MSKDCAGLRRWLSGKEIICQCRRHRFDSLVRKIPWRRKWQPTPVFSPGKSHGQRSLVGWGQERLGSDWVIKQQHCNLEILICDYLNTIFMYLVKNIILQENFRIITFMCLITLLYFNGSLIISLLKQLIVSLMFLRCTDISSLRNKSSCWWR